MTDESGRVTNGELQRVFERLERSMAEFRTENKSEMRRLGADVTLALKEISETRVRLTTSELDLSELRTEVKSLNEKVSDTVKNAAFISGGIAAIAYIGRFWPFGK